MEGGGPKSRHRSTVQDGLGTASESLSELREIFLTRFARCAESVAIRYYTVQVEDLQ